MDTIRLRRNMMTDLSTAASPVPSSCSIFRVNVPEVLRRRKKEAFEPDVVSIGPFYSQRSSWIDKLQLVENVKKWYLKCLLSRMKEAITLDSFIDSIKELEKEARGCYSDPCKNLFEFIEMLILDGCFLIELFRKAADPERRQDDDDPIFNVSCMLEYLYHDLLCLENQLPWFVLEFFYNEIERGNPDAPSLSILVINFFRNSVADPRIFSYPKPGSPEALHILDLIRSSLVQGFESFDYRPEPTFERNHLPQNIPNAVALSDIGVKIKMSASSCIFKLTFRSSGVFEIPPLVIDQRTSTLFRNLVAYEQCNHSCRHLIVSYVVLMNQLIITQEDVDVLSKKGIIYSLLNNDDASKFFKELYNEVDPRYIDFAYKGLCRSVQEYRSLPRNKTPLNGWKKILKRDYFNTPCSPISFLAAFVLLVFTFLQTIYTIQQYYRSPN